MKTWVKELPNIIFQRGIYSQSYQDSLIKYLFDQLAPENAEPFCVEFGFDGNTFYEGCGSNVARLVLERGWNCLLLDGDYSNPEINLHRHFLTPENIVSVFQQYNVPESPEYISIDIDSLDLWICRALMATYRPMVYSVEYNAHFPHWAAITVDNDPSFRWQKDRLYGASLKALTILATDIGYTLISVVPNFDAFFIRNDLIDDFSGYIAPNLNLRNATNRVLHLPVSDVERLRVLIDYEELCKPDADINIAYAKAFRIAKRYLAGNGDIETWFNRALRLGRRLFSD